MEVGGVVTALHMLVAPLVNFIFILLFIFILRFFFFFLILLRMVRTRLKLSTEHKFVAFSIHTKRLACKGLQTVQSLMCYFPIN